MPRIVFFCHDSLENIQSLEYYRQDIEGLRALGHEVVVCNRFRDIPVRFDLMFIWWWTYALLPVIWARVLRRPALVTGTFNFRFRESSGGIDYFARPWRQRFLIRQAVKLATRNVFVGAKEFAEVAEFFRINTARYMPHAVGDGYFAVADRDADRHLLLNLAWSGTANLSRKGVWTILDAATLLKQRGRAFTMILAGRRGEGFPALRQRIAELDLEDCVVATGDVTYDEKLDLFGKTRLYLQPSFYEGFGLATAEAMAAGCCVITTDVGEVSNVVGDAGRYVQPGDAKGLADAIEELLADQTKIDELSVRALDRMRRLFSFERKKATLDELLTELSLESRSN